MSKKLTKKMIDELIKEEIAKAEQERLDEFRVTMTGKSADQIRNDLGLPSSGGTYGGKVSADKLRNLAKQDGTNKKDIEDADIEKVMDPSATGPAAALQPTVDTIKTQTTDTSIQNDIQAIINRLSSATGTWATTDAGKANLPDPNSIAPSIVPKTGSGKYDKRKFAKWLNDNVLKSGVTLTSKIVQEYVDWTLAHYGRGSVGTTVNNNLTALRSAVAASGGGFGDALKYIIQALNRGISIDDRQFETFLGQMASFDVDPGIASTDPTGAVSTREVKADSSVIAQFTVFNSDSMEGILKELEETAKFLENPTTPIPTGQYQFQSRNPEFEIITKTNILVNLGILGKAYDESSAGFALEKFCALLFGGLQVGGDNGAADVYSVLANGQAVGLSQKFYNKPESIEQSISGLEAYFQKQPALYYFVASKGGATTPKGEGSAYSTIYLYIIKLEKVTPDRNANPAGYQSTVMEFVSGTGLQAKVGPFPCDYTDANIKIAMKFGGWKTQYTKKKNAKSQLSPDNYAYKIPILSAADDDVISVANYAREQLAGAGSPVEVLTKSITDIQKRLQNMQYNTQEYSAEKTKTSPVRSAREYIDALATDYTEIKKDYETVFTAGGQADITHARTKGIAEQKMKELDLMIENMVKEFIKGNLND